MSISPPPWVPWGEGFFIWGSTMHRRWGLGLTVLAMAFLIVGCGSGGNVSGKVYLGEKPLTKGMVYFTGKGNVVVSGDIQSDGSYSVVGVPVGNAKITVSKGPSFVSTDPKATKESKKDAKDAIAPKYLDAKKTPLSFDVKGGDNSFDIKLTNK